MADASICRIAGVHHVHVAVEHNGASAAGALDCAEHAAVGIHGYVIVSQLAHLGRHVLGQLLFMQGL